MTIHDVKTDNNLSTPVEITGSGEAVIFLHGFLMSPTMWQHSANHLPDGFSAVVPAQPGHGDADAAPDGFAMDDWVRWLVDILDATGSEAAHLVGHSMGGLLALEASVQFPERVRSLCLIGMHGAPWSEEERSGFVDFVKAIGGDWSDEIAQGVAAAMFSPVFTESRPDEIRKWSATVAASNRAGLLSIAKALAERPDRSTELSAIAAPALVVRGEDDDNIPEESAMTLAEEMQNARYQSMAKVGHCPPIERPRRFSALLNKQLNRIVD
ncbi:alpha/beta hydrolase [Parasphingopyxis sp.]|uniref:alpha/beta fold hydrolase n=1 Tax=Parasphingopyxis sp. TaxID=1920299 RepID=UPI002603A225|nr:alpha/beta hydrolase [Parasphingopyxis sp.]